MPIRVQNDLPVKEILEQENIFVMDEYRAAHQDIRPISIGLQYFPNGTGVLSGQYWTYLRTN